MEQLVSTQLKEVTIAKKTVMDDIDSNGLSSLEKWLLSDLQKVLFKGRTFEQYYETGTSIFGPYYKGFNKIEYGDKKLPIIIKSMKRYVRRYVEQKEAIALLHQEIKLNLIQPILRFLVVNLKILKTLKSSNIFSAERLQSIWLQNNEGLSLLKQLGKSLLKRLASIDIKRKIQQIKIKLLYKKNRHENFNHLTTCFIASKIKRKRNFIRGGIQ
jgi:hypothetical protein